MVLANIGVVIKTPLPLLEARPGAYAVALYEQFFTEAPAALRPASVQIRGKDIELTAAVAPDLPDAVRPWLRGHLIEDYQPAVSTANQFICFHIISRFPRAGA